MGEGKDEGAVKGQIATANKQAAPGDALSTKGMNHVRRLCHLQLAGQWRKALGN
jgi:hypothetical protein